MVTDDTSSDQSIARDEVLRDDVDSDTSSGNFSMDEHHLSF